MVHPEVLKAYKTNEYPYFTRAEDDNEKVFFEKAKASQHEVDHQVTQVFRLLHGGKEKMYYQETLKSKDYLNNPIDHSRTVGKYSMPNFVKRLDPQSGKALPTEINGTETIYDLDFDKKRLEQLVKEGKINEHTNFIIITLGRRYGGFSYEEFIEHTLQELHTIGRFGTTNPQTIKAIKEKERSK